MILTWILYSQLMKLHCKKAFKFDENAMSNLGNSLGFSGADLEKAFQVGGDSFELSNMVNLEEVQLDLSGYATVEFRRDSFQIGFISITGWIETNGI